jgi:hypothetical protein
MTENILTKRKNKVNCKGKGDLTTYWLSKSRSDSRSRVMRSVSRSFSFQPKIKISDMDDDDKVNSYIDNLVKGM